jgi:hypothetical protein
MLPCTEREVAGRDEALLVGKRERDASLERPERRRQAGEADDGVQDDVRLSLVEKSREIAAHLGVLHAALGSKRVQVARAGHDRARFELVVGVDDLERLAPDRPRGAQDRNSLHRQSVGT